MTATKVPARTGGVRATVERVGMFRVLEEHDLLTFHETIAGTRRRPTTYVVTTPAGVRRELVGAEAETYALGQADAAARDGIDVTTHPEWPARLRPDTAAA